MTITAHGRRRFVKDFLLPIPVCEDSCFNYYINLYENVLGSKTKYKMFTDLIEKLGGEESFFQYGSRIQQEAIEKMKGMESYKRFIGDTSNLFSGYKWTFNNVPKGQVYKSIGDKKRFFSIDIAKANYSALRYYSTKITKEEDTKDNLILGSHNFDEFISNFTEEEYFKQTKKFRQVLFGNINPKRQQTIQKYIINNILNFIIDNGIFELSQLKDYTSDEIIFEGEISEDNLKKLKQLTKDMDVDMHFEGFTLKRLNPYDMYVKEMDDGSVEFKCIENNLMTQAYKHYFGMDIVYEDLLFVANNGLLAKYLKPLEFESEE